MRFVPKHGSQGMHRILITVGSGESEDGELQFFHSIIGDSRSRGNDTHFFSLSAGGEGWGEVVVPVLVFSFDLKPIILNDRIAQESVARIIELLADDFAISFDFDLEVFADVDGADAAVTHMFQRTLDGLSLRIEHRLLWCDDYFCFHLSPIHNDRTGER